MDNFDEVLGGMAPRATFRVKNKLSEDGGEFAVNLEFKKMDDFRPESVVEQVEPLRKLLEARTKLSDLRNKLAGNDKLEDVLGEVLNNTEKLKQLGAEAQQGQE
jgi:type VI secretion system protein ImpB